MFGGFIGIHYFCRVFLETYQYEVVQMSAFVGFCGGDDVGVTGLGAVATL